jgi:Ca2+-binding EF-hand superfamily protein
MSEYQRKVKVLRILNRLSKMAKSGSVDYQKLFLEKDPKGLLAVRLTDFKEVIDKIDSVFDNSDFELLVDMFKSPINTGFIQVEYPQFCRRIEQGEKTLEQVTAFAVSVYKHIGEKNLDLLDYLKSYDRNKVGYITLDLLEAILEAHNLKVTPSEVSDIFIILNQFETDIRIDFEQVKKRITEEIANYVPGSTQGLEVSEEEKKAKLHTDLLQKIFEATTELNFGSFEEFLRRSYKDSIDSKDTLSKEMYSLAVREVYPALNEPGLQILIGLASVKPDDRVAVGKTDSLIHLSNKYANIDKCTSP